MKKVELLAPAGNMEALKAAVNAGCDAVYLGLKSFSARAFAGNFSHEEFIEAIHYCHTRNVKIYCTINTMLYETEIENAKKEVDFLYENDCDAILIQDLGLFHYVRTCYPDMPVHCSRKRPVILFSLQICLSHMLTPIEASFFHIPALVFPDLRLQNRNAVHQKIHWVFSW